VATLETAAEQQAAQRGLVALMLKDLAGTWSTLNPGRLGQTLPKWIAAVAAVLDRYGDAAGALGLDYYEAERDAAGVPGRAPSPEIRSPERAQVESSLRWATKGLWDDHVLERDPEFDRMWQQILDEEAAADLASLDEEDLADIGDDLLDEQAEPVEHRLSPAADRLAKTRTKVDGIAARLVTDVGRGAVVDAVAGDRKAVGIARVAAPNACAFCRTMTLRGAVYKNEQTAGRRANAKFTGGSGEFKYHNHCRCWTAPLFEGEEWEPQPEVAKWQEQYDRAKAMRGDTLKNFYRILRAGE
jgi:hypothetical protein